MKPEEVDTLYAANLILEGEHNGADINYPALLAYIESQLGSFSRDDLQELEQVLMEADHDETKIVIPPKVEDLIRRLNGYQYLPDVLKKIHRKGVSYKGVS